MNIFNYEHNFLIPVQNLLTGETGFVNAGEPGGEVAGRSCFFV